LAGIGGPIAIDEPKPVMAALEAAAIPAEDPELAVEVQESLQEGEALQLETQPSRLDEIRQELNQMSPEDKTAFRQFLEATQLPSSSQEWSDDHLDLIEKWMMGEPVEED
jgi:hypothetical protein